MKTVLAAGALVLFCAGVAGAQQPARKWQCVASASAPMK